MKLQFAALLIAISWMSGASNRAIAAQVPFKESREQAIFYHLHQTYELMELSKRTGCADAHALIQHHLREAQLELQASPGSAFVTEYKLLASAATSLKRLPMQKVERLRKDIQAKADLEGLRHDREWHNELGDCLASTHH
jgi:hypothetical protein